MQHGTPVRLSNSSTLWTFCWSFMLWLWLLSHHTGHGHVFWTMQAHLLECYSLTAQYIHSIALHLLTSLRWIVFDNLLISISYHNVIYHKSTLEWRSTQKGASSWSLRFLCLLTVAYGKSIIVIFVKDLFSLLMRQCDSRAKKTTVLCRQPHKFNHIVLPM